MVYEMKSLWRLARKAGIEDAEGVSSMFYPTLLIPLLVIRISPFAALLAFLACLRLPHFYFWYLAKERRKKVLQELPLFVSSLQWALTVQPVQKAICSVDVGETSRIFRDFCRRYKRGDSFEESLSGCAVFPEIEELTKRLIVIYRTGQGIDLLSLFTEKLASENLSAVRHSAARMQIFALAYTALAAVLPAMYSGLSIYSGGSEVVYLSLVACLGLVISWKIID